VEYLILAVAVIGAGLFGFEAYRKRRHLHERLDVAGLVAARIGQPSSSAGVTGLIADRVRDDPTPQWSVIGDRPEEDEEEEEEEEEEEDVEDEEEPLEEEEEDDEPRDEAEEEGSEDEVALGGVWDSLDEALDPDSFRPKLAEGAELAYFPLRWGNDYAMVSSPDRATHFTLEIWEADLVKRMDGTHSLGELVVDHLDRYGELDAPAVLGLVESLRRAGIFDPAPLDVETVVKQRLDPSSAGTKKLREFLKTLKLSWSGANDLMYAAYRGGLRYVFTTPGLVIGGILAIGGVAAYLAVVLSGRFHLTIGNPPVQAAIILVLGFVLTAAHEAAHALVLVHNGRKIGSSGFLIYFGSPAFYVDASDGLMMSTGKRIAQAAAGPLAELALAGIASIALFVWPGSSVAPFLFKFSFLNYYVIVLNLIPLLELDGYWILSDAIQVQDLRPRSLAFVQRDMWRKLWKRERFTRQEVGLALYGVLGLVFTVFTLLAGVYFWRRVFGQLLIDLWNRGAATRILLLFLVLLLAGPAVRGVIAAIRAVVRRVRAIVRRIRFRLESDWRVEAAALIDALPAFDDLPVDVLNDLAGRVKLRTVPRGQAVFYRGDRADAFYVIRTGRVAVEDEDPETGDTTVLTTLARGESFGELGLLRRSPRQATIRAVDDVELFEVDRPTFDRLLAEAIEAPDFGPTMQTYAELKALPAFRTLPIADLSEVLGHGGWVSAAPGERLVEQGDIGDAFYVIAAGQVDVTKDGSHVTTLGTGRHFGEIALLEDVPRTASVTARTPLRAFRLDREGFEAILADAFRHGTLRPATDRTWEH
jgi:CRP-like cAMP-binding protein/Zn-dependent protease